MEVKIGRKIGIDSAYKGLDSAFRERLTKSDLKHFQNGYNQAIQDMHEEMDKMGITSIDACAEGKCVKISDLEKSHFCWRGDDCPKKTEKIDPESTESRDGVIVKTFRIRIF